MLILVLKHDIGREDSSQASNYHTEASHAATSVEVSDNVPH